jgi:hypothetical protein
MILRLLLLYLTLAFSTANAQIFQLLDPGQSGIGVTRLYEHAHGFQGYILEGSGVYKGNLELSFAYNYYNYDVALEGLTSPEATSRGLMAGMTWWFLKGSILPNLTASASFRGGLDSYTFKDFNYISPIKVTEIDYLGYFNLDLGLVAALNFKVGENWSLQPAFAMDFEIAGEKSQLAQSHPENFTTGIASRFVLSIGRKVGPSSWIRMHLCEHFDSYNLETYYNMGVGYVLALGAGKWNFRDDSEPDLSAGCKV